MLVTVIVTMCLSGVCVEKTVTDQTTLSQCMMVAQPAIAQWMEENGYTARGYVLRKWGCAIGGIDMLSNAEKQAEKERNFTAEMLRAALHYDPSTGIFRHIHSKRGIKAGAIAGRFSGKGYWQLCIDYQYFYAQRLAWLYVTSEWPPCEVDHDDLDKTNNRFANLRLATDLQNQGNRPASRNNRSGTKGVRWYARTGKWQARISIKSKSQHLGYFVEKSDAEAAYFAAAQKHFGKFARSA